MTVCMVICLLNISYIHRAYVWMYGFGLPYCSSHRSKPVAMEVWTAPLQCLCLVPNFTHDSLPWWLSAHPWLSAMMTHCQWLCFRSKPAAVAAQTASAKPRLPMTVEQGWLRSLKVWRRFRDECVCMYVCVCVCVCMYVCSCWSEAGYVSRLLVIYLHK